MPRPTNQPRRKKPRRVAKVAKARAETSPATRMARSLETNPATSLVTNPATSQQPRKQLRRAGVRDPRASMMPIVAKKIGKDPNPPHPEATASTEKAKAKAKAKAAKARAETSPATSLVTSPATSLVTSPATSLATSPATSPETSLVTRHPRMAKPQRRMRIQHQNSWPSLSGA